MKKHITQTIDGIDFKLKEKHDFTWLKTFGKVFKVYDAKDSGNILFGVEKDNRKYFIKYAGAYTLDYGHDAQGAIERLKKASQKYEAIKHPALIPLIEHKEIGDGYILIHEWHEGECLHDYWMFSKRLKYVGQKDFIELTKYKHKDASMHKFKNLFMEKRIKAYSIILDFVNTVHKAGYQAVDFNDNQIVYDFENDELKICDIDLYEKKPYVNPGKILFMNSERFRAPEECKEGSVCDEITNV
ncbi:MAG: serine/threonine protein kinase [Clostridiales bacterium]|nr:serine/threonine protein kinase [Clostridiales bacterium]